MKSKEDAVSPVIGVILMVAVTVILAAVIAAFVFGMGSGVNETRTVAVTCQQVSTAAGGVEFTYQGGDDADEVGAVFCSVMGGAREAIFSVPPVVGEVDASGATPTTAQDHVVVIAQFLDGTEQVILDTYV
jgi:flagellin-like protein